MRVFVQFDCYADIIIVPNHVATQIDMHQKRFLKWIYNKRNKHQYWVKVNNGRGVQFYGVQYGIDAFVNWLNDKVVKNPKESVMVEKRNLDVTSYDNSMLRIYF